MDERKKPDLVGDDYPDFWEQMQNFQKFLQDVGQGAKEGNALLVSEDKRQLREDLCSQCSEYNPTSKRCRQCGCFMEMKWRFTRSTCPLSLW